MTQEKIQELLRIAEENGTQAVPALLELVKGTMPKTLAISNYDNYEDKTLDELADILGITATQLNDIFAGEYSALIVGETEKMIMTDNFNDGETAYAIFGTLGNQKGLCIEIIKGSENYSMHYSEV